MSFTMAVKPGTAAPPDIRVRLSPGTSIERAKAVQDRVTGLPVAARSVLASPFQAMEVTLTANREVDNAVRQIRTSLERDPAVVAVDACPCAHDAAGPDKTPVAAAQYLVQRNCAASRRPVPVSGCVTEFEMIGDAPVEGCSPDHVLAFEARSRQVAGQRVHKLTGRVTTVKPARTGAWTPIGDSVLTRENHVVPGKIAGYYGGTWAYNEEMDFSPGTVHTDPYGGRKFLVTTTPKPAGTSPVKLKGAVEVCGEGRVPAKGLDRRYEVVVDVAKR